MEETQKRKPGRPRIHPVRVAGGRPGRPKEFTDEELAEHRREYWRDYYARNREKILAKNKAWTKAHRVLKPKRPAPTEEKLAERKARRTAWRRDYQKTYFARLRSTPEGREYLRKRDHRAYLARKARKEKETK